MEEREQPWIDYKLNPPPSHLDRNSDIEVSYDGETADDSVEYMDRRTCIMAGIAGGFGYFGEGWGTNGNNGCDYGLKCDDPTHWRHNTTLK